MGWFCYDATHYDRHGKVDRKAEMDRLYNWEDETKTVKVLKSALYGATYYAAVEVTEKETGKRYVTAAVDLTSSGDGWYNFGYKAMGETMGPYQYDCPKGILDLLTPTENEYALQWRERCRANLKRKSALKKAEFVEVKFPYDLTWSDGFTVKAGEPVTLERRRYNNRACWCIPGTNKVVKRTSFRNGEILEIERL